MLKNSSFFQFCLFEVPLTKNIIFVIFREPKHFLIFQCKIVPLQCPTVLTLFTVWFYHLPFSSYKRFSIFPFIFIILETSWIPALARSLKVNIPLDHFQSPNHVQIVHSCMISPYMLSQICICWELLSQAPITPVSFLLMDTLICGIECHSQEQVPSPHDCPAAPRV